MADLKQLYRDLITANHILHYHGLVDAYGHISVRHPDQPDTYIMSANMAPALVSSPTDLVQYRIEDSVPCQNDNNAPKGFIERYIHSEMYKRYQDVQCVIHSHAETVLPFAISGVPMKPMYHMAGFLGSEVPVFDIAHSYQPGDIQDLLIRNIRFGAVLATKFSSASNPQSQQPDHNVVLMRGHGFTTYGSSIKEAVYRAFYTAANAKLQTSACLLRSSINLSSPSSSSTEIITPVHSFEPLTPQQAKDADASNSGTTDRPWRLWVKEVESRKDFYINNA